MSLLSRVRPAVSVGSRFWRVSRSFGVTAAPAPKLKEEYLKPVEGSFELEEMILEPRKFDPRLLENLEQLEVLFKECEEWPVGMYALNEANSSDSVPTRNKQGN